jgi:hypothetical protein
VGPNKQSSLSFVGTVAMEASRKTLSDPQIGSPSQMTHGWLTVWDAEKDIYITVRKAVLSAQCRRDSRRCDDRGGPRTSYEECKDTQNLGMRENVVAMKRV